MDSPSVAPVPVENPVDPAEKLGQASSLPTDSATTTAEKADAASAKRKRQGDGGQDDDDADSAAPLRKKGVAAIKPEFLVEIAPRPDGERPLDDRDRGRKPSKGQNHKRTFGTSKDAIQLCRSRANAPEFSPDVCQYGDSCRLEHDLRKYLRQGKRAGLDTFDGKCPVWQARGKCNAGWKCRFVDSHSQERLLEDGRKELVLTQDSAKIDSLGLVGAFEGEIGVVNVVAADDKVKLRKKQRPTPKADAYIEYLNKLTQVSNGYTNKSKFEKAKEPNGDTNGTQAAEEVEDNRARYVEPPLLPSEKRRLYYGPETPVLSPLTTQGNLPFRRLCVNHGAQITWSEMAMSMPLLQGEKSEWALPKAHETELAPPRFHPTGPVVQGYDNARDSRFGVQIAANQPWQALRATEVLTALCPHLRAVDLNCGCPIDLVYRQGAGSALLDAPSKLEKILRGMNAVSGEVPITVKIRTGTKDNKNTSARLVERLAFGIEDEYSGHKTEPCGVAAVTLHGRSRQQRYTRSADWTYISECAALIKKYNEGSGEASDTVREADGRQMSPNRIYFIGNGDCYSHEDYYRHIEEAKVDSVMVARGALMKPWIFEEIEAGQYLDKTASERLGYVEEYARYGLETWGSDEMGVGTTRRFLLEWLSFACRYVPVGLLEHLPPSMQDRPPAYRGRNELETLMASDNYKDWIKISDMFLGPAHPGFQFEPKHKSNSYDYNAEG